MRAAEHCPVCIFQARGGGAIPGLALICGRLIARFVAVLRANHWSTTLPTTTFWVNLALYGFIYTRDSAAAVPRSRTVLRCVSYKVCVPYMEYAQRVYSTYYTHFPRDARCENYSVGCQFLGYRERYTNINNRNAFYTGVRFSSLGYPLYQNSTTKMIPLTTIHKKLRIFFIY